MPPRWAKLAGLGAFGAIALFVGLYAFLVYITVPRSTGGIDGIQATVTWIALGIVILALVGLHVVLGRELLDLSKGKSSRV